MVEKLTACECYRLLMAYIDEVKAVKEYGDLSKKIMGKTPEIEELSNKLRKRLMSDEGDHADILAKALEKHCSEYVKWIAETAKKCEE